MKTKSSRFFLAIFFAFFIITGGFSAFAQEPYAVFMERISSDLTKNVNLNFLNKKTADYLKLIKEDGSWSDIDYSDLYYAPLSRTRELAQAYVSKKSAYYGDSNIYKAIIKTLENWNLQNPKNKNWWYNDIFYPQTIGQTLILMRSGKEKLSYSLEQRMIKQMLIKKIREGNGANTSDEALHYLFRACLTENKATLDSAVHYLFEPIVKINDFDGAIQPDNSYFQHGKQPAIASYGKVFVFNSVNAAYFLRDTKHQLPKAQLDLLINYIKNTYLQTLRGKYFDFNVRGRGISRKDSLIEGLSELQDKLIAIDPQDKSFWQASKDRIAQVKPASYNVDSRNTMYWKSNYTLHIRPNYTFSVLTSSDRIFRTEYGNGENLFGNYLPDGATNIQRSGSEYAWTVPVWEWDKIPGTTSRDFPHDEGAAMKGRTWGQYGTSKFSGGISDGHYGAAAYDLQYDEVSAKKAWFFFDKEVACLGAGITSAAEEVLTTTLNQSRLVTPVIFKSIENKPITLAPNSENEVKNIKWLWQDSIAYFFPQGGTLCLSNKMQSGSWSKINNQQSNAEITQSVFKAWLQHGAKPTNASYAYVVVPGLNTTQAADAYPSNQIAILENSAKIQAVQHVGLDILQVVFYQAGALKTKELTIQVDAPCMMYINKLHAETPLIYVSDPRQVTKQIAIDLKFPSQTTLKRITCDLPLGEMAGSPVSIKIKSNQ
ncbi:polysaccharide lyase family 8 super-sandwich domain-containing protein [Pedobacter sp. MW01-1-1]|uniref:polysaccharide lyase family 8 super-sandwich domain-containing protein n=1 Tax=Pedobacter sp. MW01-1-1 TaxID=3383027 RepID=UPI003FED4817